MGSINEIQFAAWANVKWTILATHDHAAESRFRCPREDSGLSRLES
jgi:hypothetical protein